LAKKKTDETDETETDEIAQTDPTEEADSPVDFETSLGEIEEIVKALESGELSLDASLEQYESAVAKMRRCYRMLEIAERKISVLAGFDADGNAVTEPLEER